MILNHSLWKWLLVKCLMQTNKWSNRAFQTFSNNTFSQIKVSKKAFQIAGNFNLNLLDHDTNKKVPNVLNLVYKNGMTPTINPTRVTRKAATPIDHIRTNEIVFKTAIFKSDIRDHFSICFLVPLSSAKEK